ncbi:MAG TPA: AraC family transcriptional regulator [Paucimonas sp.]|nr:AraC family transcriptional regulator [Paucimonas sp.]
MNVKDKDNPMAAARLYLGARHALYVGGTTAGRHRHHAVQISMALGRPFRMRAGDDAWREYGGAVIPPDAEHEFDSEGEPVANMFLDVESADYRAILHTAGNGGAEQPRAFDAAPDLLQALRLFHERGAAAGAAPELCARIVEAALGVRLPRKSIDARVSKVLEMIGADPAAKIRTQCLADAVALSQSRLAHLFSEQVGVPLRRYRLWKAIREAIRLCMSGATLTDAAHAAGFADSAHFSNSFRDLFGLSPSLLLSRQAAVEVLLGDDFPAPWPGAESA